MVDVIKPGRGYVCEVVCTGFGNGGNGCGAVLGCQREDLRYWPGVGGDTWGSSDPAVVVKCPECKSLTDIPTRQWPQRADQLTEMTQAWKR